MPSSRSTRRWPPGPSFWAGEGYEWLAARWPSRSGELADRLNSLPKYVVSATLANPAWNNSTVLKGDVLNEVSTLKQHIDGDIVIAGSFQLVRTLIEHDLVDELRLKIFPVALGVGERLFGETSDKKPRAPHRHPDPRGRHRLPHLPICPGRLAASDGASVPKCLRALPAGRHPGERPISSRWQEGDHSNEDARYNVPLRRY